MEYRGRRGTHRRKRRLKEIGKGNLERYITSNNANTHYCMVQIYIQIQHENVLSLLGISVDGNNMMILLEYCMHGNLKSYLIKNRYRMNVMKRDGRVLQMIIEAGKGLHYLHTMGIAHKYI